jgi:hypothetical protein
LGSFKGLEMRTQDVFRHENVPFVAQMIAKKYEGLVGFDNIEKV